MKCEHVAPWLSAYADGELDPERYATVAAHLDACGRCRCEAEYLRDLGAALWETLGPEGGVPDVSATVARQVHRVRQWDIGVRVAATVLVAGLSLSAWWWQPAPELVSPQAPVAERIATPRPSAETVRTDITSASVAVRQQVRVVRPITAGHRGVLKRHGVHRARRSYPIIIARRQRPTARPPHVLVAERAPVKAPPVETTSDVVVVSVPPAYYPLDDPSVEYVLRRDASPPAATSLATGGVPGVVE